MKSACALIRERPVGIALAGLGGDRHLVHRLDPSAPTPGVAWWPFAIHCPSGWRRGFGLTGVTARFLGLPSSLMKLLAEAGLEMVMLKGAGRGGSGLPIGSIVGWFASTAAPTHHHSNFMKMVLGVNPWPGRIQRGQKNPLGSW